MLSVNSDYAEMLAHLDAALKHAKNMRQAMQTKEYARFSEFFGSYSELVSLLGKEDFLKYVQSMHELYDDISKLPSIEEYRALCQTRNLLRSPGLRLTGLLKKAGAQKAELISNQLLDGGIHERIAEYNKKVQEINQIANGSGKFLEEFSLQPRKPGNNSSHVNTTARYGRPLGTRGQVQVGSIIKWGTYPQTSSGNDRTPIEWQVLGVQENRALLISKFALDCQQYNSKDTFITWEKCTLRTWLNSTFYNKAFSSAEQKAIPTVTVTADKNPSYSTSAGNNTQDKVFLLSITEVNKYFKDNDARKCIPTDYAVKQGASTSSSYKKDGRATCWWWLRSPGRYQRNAACVCPDGSLSDGYVDDDDIAVRPALYVDLNLIP